MTRADIRSVTFERQGFTWTVGDFGRIACDLFIDGSYHSAEIAALSQWMRRNGVMQESRDVFVDAGANIGTTCLPMVRETGGRALAIEPIRGNFWLLAKNVESNGLSDRIVLARKAISRTPGSMRMCLTLDSGGNFTYREGLAEPRAHAIVGHEEVTGDTLTGIVAGAGFRLDEIALVWADVQGCELEVVESGRPLWERGVPLWAEVEPSSLRLQGAMDLFVPAVAAHFDRFITAYDLKEFGERAALRPVGDLSQVIEGIKPEQLNADLLFLPPAFQVRV
jgi:FkbM family methyltransferase